MSALAQGEISDFWVATGSPITFVLLNQLNNNIGEYPLLKRKFPEDGFDVIENLLTGAEVKFKLREDVTFSRCAHFYILVNWFSVHAGMV